MKTKTRIFAGIFAVVLLAGMFSGCGRSKSGRYSLNGEKINDYTIVVPAGADICETYAAELLRDSIAKLTEIEPEIVDDSQAPVEYEILIGKTNRPESKGDFDFGDYGYAVYSQGTKAVLLGDSFTVSGGIAEIMESITKGKTLPSDKTVRKYEPEDTKSVILLLGDGMGENHVLLAETEKPKTLTSDGVAVPDEKSVNGFLAKSFPNIGKMTTLNYDGEITDSAASATALATGYKTVNGVLGMIPQDLDSDGNADELASVQNVREAASLKSMKTAILSTDRVTGATPNSFLVHYSDRYALSAIMEQSKSLKESKFAPEYVWCGYDSEDFCEMFKTAIKQVDCKAGFFVMAEEAMIDKYSTRLDFDNVIRTVKRLDSVTRLAMTYVMCHPDTAIIVTADHETGGLSVGEKGEFMWTSDGEHTDTPVGVYAIGEGTERFAGKTVDNTDIAHFIFDIIDK